MLNALDPVEFERQFRGWVRALTDDLAGQVVAIDGKTLRGAVDRAGSGTAMHMLHVWAAEQQLLLAHAIVDGAGREISGIPELLRFLDVRGAIITTDANGCTAPITQAIRAAEADDVLALKGNRSTLHTHVVEAFAAVEAMGYHDINTHQTIDTGHGRVEDRTFRAMAIPSLPPTSQVTWADLATIVQVDRVRTAKGATTVERQYFVSNLPPDAAVMAHAVRTDALARRASAPLSPRRRHERGRLSRTRSQQRRQLRHDQALRPRHAQARDHRQAWHRGQAPSRGLGQ